MSTRRSEPVPDCPQPETPIRERAWAPGQEQREKQHEPSIQGR